MKLRHCYNIVCCLALLVLVGCTTDPTCHQTQKPRAGLAVDSMLVWNKEASVFVVSDKWDTVSVYGVPTDSVLIYQGKNVHQIDLPLRGDTTITQYRLDWKGLSDTISIHHTNDYQYISFACGCFVYHVIDSVWSTHHFIEKFYITDSDVQEKGGENMRITVRSR